MSFKLKIPKRSMQLLLPSLPGTPPLSTPLPGSGDHVTHFPELGQFYLTNVRGLEKMIPHMLPETHVISFVELDFVLPIQEGNHHQCLLPDGIGGTEEMAKCIVEFVPPVLQWLREGLPVVVHCQEGISRSVTFATAVVMAWKHQNNEIMSPDDVIEYIHKLRVDPENPQRHLNKTEVKFCFMCELYHYYKTLIV